MSTSRLRSFLTALSVASIAMSAAACGDGRSTVRESPSPPMDVRVAKAAVQPLAQTFEAGGIIKARMTAQITSRMAAELLEVRVQPGDREHSSIHSRSEFQWSAASISRFRWRSRDRLRLRRTAVAGYLCVIGH